MPTVSAANPATQAEIRNLSPIPARFVVKSEGANAVAYDMSDGTIIAAESDHDVAIQAALDGLTSGRNWKETVTLKGDFTLTDNLLLSSYTKLDIQGSLTGTTTETNTNVITNEGTSTEEVSFFNVHGETDTAQAGSATSITLAAGASAVADYYVGYWISILSGAGQQTKRQITAYNESTKVATVATIKAQYIPDATSIYSISPFAVGEEITGGTSAFTATVDAVNWDNGVGTLELSGATGLFTVGETITGDGAATNSALIDFIVTNKHMDVLGGTIDVNDLEATNDNRGIEFLDARGVSIRNVSLKDSGHYLIQSKRSHDVLISGCYLENSGDDNISVIDKSSNVVVTNNVIVGGKNADSYGGTAGIEVENAAYNVTVSNNVVRDIEGIFASGIHLINDPTGIASCYNITIANNVVTNCIGNGISASNNKVDDAITNITGMDGTGPIVITSVGHNVTPGRWRVFIADLANGFANRYMRYLTGWQWVQYVDADTLHVDMADLAIPITATYGSGGVISYDSHNVSIVGNSVADVDGTGIYVKQAKNSSVTGNSVSGAGMELNGHQGLAIVDVEEMVVANNSVSYSGLENIIVDGANNSIIDGNILVNSAINTPGGEQSRYNIQLTDAVYCTVSNNTCLDGRSLLLDANYQQSYGINAGSGNNIHIFGNDVHGAKPNSAGKGRILCTATDCYIHDNNGASAAASGYSEVVTAANTLYIEESGMTYYLDLAAGFASTLPAPYVGIKYRFVVSTVPSVGDYTIVTASGTDLIHGVITVDGASIGSSSTPQDTITFNSAANEGDWVELECDGTSWFATGQGDAAGSIAFSVT